LKSTSEDPDAEKAASLNEPLPMALPHEASVGRLEKMADLLDQRFTIPGTRIGVGLDAVLGLIPGVGDTVTAIPGLYLIGRAKTLGVRKRTLLRMAKNLGIDLVIGAIPLVGDWFDIGFRSNVKNVALIRSDLRRQAELAGH